MMLGTATRLHGATLRNHIHDVAGTQATLCGKGVGLDLEFLHAINRGHVNHSTPAQCGIPRPIQQEGTEGMGNQRA